MPPVKTTAAFDNGGAEPELTPSEMAAITKFHKKGYDPGSWSQKEKEELSCALNKAYGPESVLRGGDFANLRSWFAKVGFFK